MKYSHKFVFAIEAVGSDWKFTVQKVNKNYVFPYDIIQEDPWVPKKNNANTLITIVGCLRNCKHKHFNQVGTANEACFL